MSPSLIASTEDAYNEGGHMGKYHDVFSYRQGVRIFRGQLFLLLWLHKLLYVFVKLALLNL